MALSRAAVIDGTIRDGAGQPVSGASVKALRLRHTHAGAVRLEPAGRQAAMFTDERGRFRIFDLVPGRYVVIATPTQMTALSGARADGPGAPLWAHSETYYPSGRSFTDARVIDLAAGEEHIGTDVSLTFASTSTLRGRVVLPDGSAAPQAPRLSVTVQGDYAAELMVVAPRQGAVLGPAALVTSTMADGTFHLSTLPPGTYTLRAQTTVNDVVFWAAVDVPIQGGDVSDLVMRLERAPSIEAHIVWEASTPPPLGLAGIVLRPDFSGAPVGMVRVPFPKDHSSASASVFPGDYHVSLEGVPPGWFLDRPILASAGQGPVELRVTDTPNTFEGSVEAVSGYVLAVSADAYAYFASVGEDGRYEFDHLPPGAYNLIVLTEIEAVSALDLPVAARAALAATGGHSVCTGPQCVRP